MDKMKPIMVVLLGFLLQSLVSLSLINEAIGYMKDDSKRRVSSQSKYYPQWYQDTPNWIKKHIWPADPIIPIFTYFEVLLGLIFAVLGPINIGICIVLGYKYAYILFFIHMSLIVATRLLAGLIDYVMWKK